MYMASPLLEQYASASSNAPRGTSSDAEHRFDAVTTPFAKDFPPFGICFGSDLGFGCGFGLGVDLTGSC